MTHGSVSHATLLGTGPAEKRISRSSSESCDVEFGVEYRNSIMTKYMRHTDTM